MIRAIVLSAAIAAAQPTVAANEQHPLDRYIDLLEKMAPADRKGAAAGAIYYFCSTEAAERLAKAGIWNEGWAPRSLRPAGKVAAKAADQCEAEEAALSALVEPDQLQTIKGLMQKINAETAKRAWRDQTDGVMKCAQAEWSGCAMKPIPEWKGVRP